MTSGESEYSTHEYIADRERQAYVDAGGVEAHRRAESEFTPFGHAMGASQRAEAKREAADAAAKYGRQQAQALSENHRLWDKPTALGATNYLSYPHEDLARFVRENFETEPVHEAGRYYNKVGNDLVEFSGRIRDAAVKTEESWQGAAGDAMRGHVTKVADGMGRTGEAAQLTGNQLGMQAEAGERARNAMPEDPQFDLQQELLMAAQNPDPAAANAEANAVMQRAEHARAAHEEAADVVSTMEKGFGDAAVSTPKFAPPPPPPADQGETSANQPNAVGGFASPGGSGGSPAPTASSWSSPSGGAAPSSAASPVSASGPGYAGSQAPAGTSSSWTTSNNSGLPPGAVRGPDGTIYRQDPRTGQWMRQNPHNGRWAPVPPGHRTPGGGRAGGAPGVAGRAGGGAPGNSGRAGGGFGPRGSASGGGQLTPGGRAGTGMPGSSSAGAPAGSATSGASSARGGGRMPMGGMGGQGQQGGDGEEHERKFLVETDEAWDDLGIQPVAPPVLGALPDEEGGR